MTVKNHPHKVVWMPLDLGLYHRIDEVLSILCLYQPPHRRPGRRLNESSVAVGLFAVLGRPQDEADN